MSKIRDLLEKMPNGEIPVSGDVPITWSIVIRGVAGRVPDLDAICTAQEEVTRAEYVEIPCNCTSLGRCKPHPDCFRCLGTGKLYRKEEPK